MHRLDGCAFDFAADSSSGLMRYELWIMWEYDWLPGEILRKMRGAFVFTGGGNGDGGKVSAGDWQFLALPPNNSARSPRGRKLSQPSPCGRRLPGQL